MHHFIHTYIHKYKFVEQVRHSADAITCTKRAYGDSTGKGHRVQSIQLVELFSFLCRVCTLGLSVLMTIRVGE